MGRGEKVNCKSNFKRRVRSKDEDPDDSDEDYVVENEDNVSDDELEDSDNSLDGYASEESFGNYVEKEEEEEEDEFRKDIRSKKNKGSQEKGKAGGKIERKRKRVSYEEEEDEDYVNDDDDDDEEFILEEDDNCLDEEEGFVVKKKSNNIKVGKRRTQNRSSGRGPKRRKKSRVLGKSLVKKRRKNRRLRKKSEFDDDEDDEDVDFIDDSPVVREKSKKNSGVRRRRCTVDSDSDSDFVLSGSDDYEYTISEEEREQLREASELCGDLKIGLRSSSSVKKIEENMDLSQQRKPVGRKGKEKVKEVTTEVGKQVCGICLSEEDKRRLRGTLDCCTHYFCFTCIMEWSKVETRCPLCKQRFETISKNGRSTVGVDLRNVVIQVPKRDQVYQPSEEEIRSFIDPYENVICTECHEGGDDGLMLLCDLCDSPYHTYCVGLGRQVPEGNWYCEGCRPVALGSSSSQPQNPLPDQRTATNNVFNRLSPIVNLGEGLDPSLNSPRVGFAPGFGNLSSPIFSSGDFQLDSPLSGAGAPTLSVRRQIQRRIQNLLSLNRMNVIAGRTDGISPANVHNDLSDYQTDQGREPAFQTSRTQEIETSEHTLVKERLQINDHPSSSLQNRDLTFRPNQLRMQVAGDPTINTIGSSVNLTLWPGLVDINSTPTEQFHQYNSMSSIGSNGNLSPHRITEESQFYVAKEQLQAMVKSHLECLSQDIELGRDTFKDITRSSTHTILAACGLEHRRSEVHAVPPPSICSHIGVAAGQTSMMKGFCSSCFDSFVREVVKRIMNTRLPQWLSLGL